jgi:cytochrome P450
MSQNIASIDIGSAVRTPEFFRDPYTIYRTLREAGPVVRDEVNGTVELFGYAEVSAALRDPRLIAARSDEFFRGLEPEQLAAFRPLAISQRNMMLFSDPPAHTRLRGLVNKAFTPRVVDSLRTRIQAIVDDLLAPLNGADEFDVMEALAYPLPILVILELLGVPREDRGPLKARSNAFAAFLDGAGGAPGVPEAANAAIIELNDYFREVIARRRVEPGIDLISGLIAAEEQGNVLSEDEMLSTCVIILVAGHETTTNLIGNGLLALVRDPEAMAAFTGADINPRSTIDELLRFDSPVQLTSRMAAAPIEYGDLTVEPGTFVDIWLGAANRDPARFTDPDRLDLARADNRHMAFGYGVHFCVGAPLARLEGEIALRTLVGRFPELAVASEDLTYHNSLVFRALTRLPVWPEPRHAMNGRK